MLKGNKVLAELQPGQRFYPNQQSPFASVDARYHLGDDLYAILSTFERDGSSATIKVMINPMMAWIWIGGCVILFGVLVAVLPERRLAMLTARAKVQNAEKEMAQARKGGIFKVAGAMEEKNQVSIRLQAERQALALAQEELEKTTIRAPIAGIVIQYEAFRDEQKRKPRVGDSVWQNYPLLYLPDIASGQTIASRLTTRATARTAATTAGMRFILVSPGLISR